MRRRIEATTRVQRSIWTQLAGFLSFVLLWQLLHSLLDTHTIPSPLSSFSYLKLPLLLHALASIARVLVAVAIALLIAVPAGILLGTGKWFGRLLSPFVYFVYPIPKVAFLPVFMLLFGLGNTSKIMLIIWIIVFQIMLSVRDGVAQVPEPYFRVMNGYGASRGQVWRYLVLPAILPHMFSGLRISIGISLASLFFAENYATDYGIGYLIMSAWARMNYAEMFCGIVVMGLVGLLLFKSLDVLQTWCAPWTKRSTEKE